MSDHSDHEATAPFARDERTPPALEAEPGARETVSFLRFLTEHREEARRRHPHCSLAELMTLLRAEYHRATHQQQSTSTSVSTALALTTERDSPPRRESPRPTKLSARDPSPATTNSPASLLTSTLFATAPSQPSSADTPSRLPSVVRSSSSSAQTLTSPLTSTASTASVDTAPLSASGAVPTAASASLPSQASVPNPVSAASQAPAGTPSPSLAETPSPSFA
eukprot:CAMPEP_0174234038 /NCGR_PEP_ID=MMETSP0417-20130205/3912_1 /TAXON_ID=242541 /ORGANISM="Mayorella sp, Strain BSH-02190019" /LENGTH=222 /DNA_ID=CAMNT_0015312341 /DNA_START=66 /DNA_END=731 /DNA_ORIENTATION=-